jgi:hypothetical protein
MSPDHLSRLAVDELAQFVLRCARDDPALLSRSDFDAIGTAPAPRRRPIVAAISVAGFLAASATIALYGYDYHPGVQATGFAAANGSADLLPQAVLPPAETQSAVLVAHDVPPGSAAEVAVSVAAPTNPALRPIAIGREESAAVGGEPPAATLRKKTPTTVALLPQAALAVASETLPQEAPAVAPPSETLRQAGPGVAPDVDAMENAEESHRPSGAMASVRDPFAATLHQPAESGEPHLPVPVPSTRVPRRHVIYHTYRQPARRFVYYRSYYPPGPAAMLAQFATNVRRKLDGLFH